MAERQGIHLPVQDTRVQAPVREDPQAVRQSGPTAPEPVCLGPVLSQRSHTGRSLCPPRRAAPLPETERGPQAATRPQLVPESILDLGAKRLRGERWLQLGPRQLPAWVSHCPPAPVWVKRPGEAADTRPGALRPGPGVQPGTERLCDLVPPKPRGSAPSSAGIQILWSTV